MSFDPTALLNSLAQIGVLVVPLLVVLGVLGGLALFGRAGYLMVMGRGGGGPHDVPFADVGISMLIGACLIQFSRSVNSTRELLGGAGSEVRAAMTYMATGGGGSAFATLALNTALLWVGAIGAVGVFRGLLLWWEMGSGNNRGGGGESFWRGLWHILGGGLCVNIGLG